MKRITSICPRWTWLTLLLAAFMLLPGIQTETLGKKPGGKGGRGGKGGKLSNTFGKAARVGLPSSFRSGKTLRGFRSTRGRSVVRRRAIKARKYRNTRRKAYQKYIIERINSRSSRSKIVNRRLRSQSQKGLRTARLSRRWVKPQQIRKPRSALAKKQLAAKVNFRAHLKKVTNGVTKTPANRLNHIFGKPEHALDGLVKQFGTQDKAYNAVQNAANQALKSGKLTPDAKGILPSGNAGNIINVGGSNVRLIGGRVVDGKVVIASFSRKGL